MLRNCLGGPQVKHAFIFCLPRILHKTTNIKRVTLKNTEIHTVGLDIWLVYTEDTCKKLSQNCQFSHIKKKKKGFILKLQKAAIFSELKFLKNIGLLSTLFCRTFWNLFGVRLSLNAKWECPPVLNFLKSNVSYNFFFFLSQIILKIILRCEIAQTLCYKIMNSSLF